MDGWYTVFFSFLLGRFGLFFREHVFFSGKFISPPPPRFFTTFKQTTSCFIVEKLPGFSIFFSSLASQKTSKLHWVWDQQVNMTCKHQTHQTKSIKEIHPGRLTWKPTSHSSRKENWSSKTSMIMFHVSSSGVYGWWFRNQAITTWDVKETVNNGINYQPQLVDAGFLNQ